MYLYIIIFILLLCIAITQITKTKTDPRLCMCPNGEIESNMSEQYTNHLKKAQKVMTNMLKELDRICQTHAIPYWCCSGTLLGVDRHLGWIPWDGDVDVGILEEDYQRLEKVIGKELPKGMWFQTQKSDPNWPGVPYISGKIRDLNSCYIEDKERSYHNGLQVDIFVAKKKEANITHDGKLYKEDIIFPLQRAWFDGIQVSVPNQIGAYLKIMYGEYPLPLFEWKKRFPHEGEPDPDNTCPHHLELYPDLYP